MPYPGNEAGPRTSKCSAVMPPKASGSILLMWLTLNPPKAVGSIAAISSDVNIAPELAGRDATKKLATLGSVMLAICSAVKPE